MCGRKRFDSATMSGISAITTANVRKGITNTSSAPTKTDARNSDTTTEGCR